MIKPKQAAIPFGMALLLALFGEAFELTYACADSAVAPWVRRGYFALVFAAVCLIFWLLRREKIQKRLLLIALLWLLIWVFFYLFGFLGLSERLVNLFHIPFEYLGDFGYAALFILHGSILFRALLYSTLFCVLVCWIRRWLIPHISRRRR